MNTNILLIESTRFRILEINVNELKKNMNGINRELLQSCSEYGSLYQYLNHTKVTNSAPNENGVEKPIISIFYDKAPGFMDNIRVDVTQNNEQNDKSIQYFIGVGTKSTHPFSLLWVGYQSIILRDIIGKLIPMKYVEKLAPKYGFVLVLNQDGEEVTSLQDPSGAVISYISEAHRHPLSGDLYFGSHSNNFLGKLDKQYVSLD